MTLANRITALAQSIAADIKSLYALMLRRQNIALLTIPDQGTFTHSLNTTSLVVLFFDPQGYPVPNMSYEFVDNSTIRIYLPILDDEDPPTFTGEVFLIVRNQLT